MTPEILTSRTEAFARRIVRLCLPMLDDPRTCELARHLLRAGTAANANYISAQRGRTHDEFTIRLEHACEDAVEAKDWIEALCSAGIVTRTGEIEILRTAAEELTALLACAYRAAKAGDGVRPDRREAIPQVDNPIER